MVKPSLSVSHSREREQGDQQENLSLPLSAPSGLFRYGGREGPDDSRRAPHDHRSASSADHPGEEAGGGGARRRPAPAAPEEGVQVQGRPAAADVTGKHPHVTITCLVFIISPFLPSLVFSPVSPLITQTASPLICDSSRGGNPF